MNHRRLQTSTPEEHPRHGRTRPVVALLAVTAVLLTGCGNRLSHEEVQAAGGGTGSVESLAGGTGDATSPDGTIVGGSDAGATTGAVPGSAAGAVGVGGTSGAVTSTTGGAAGSAASGTSGTTGSRGSTGTAAAAGFSALAGPNAPIFGGNAACKPATLSPVNIGNVSTLSGVLGELFSPVVPALQTFVKSQNACGGLNGHPIKLFLGDDQGDPSTAVSVAKGQIANDKIIAFLGNIQVLTIDAMVNVVNDSGIPMIGGDITNNTWFTNKLIFPQGAPPQAISYGYLNAAKEHFKVKKIGDIYCLEVPQACQQIDKAFVELAPKFGLDVVYNQQVSITSASYQSQCLNAANAGVQMMAMTFDAASQKRLARNCADVNFRPKWAAYPLGVGNEGQFLGEKLLGSTYVPLNTFAWMANSTPAEKYWQKSIKRFNPGFTTGDAAGLGWTAGALLVAASAKLGEKPTTQQVLDGLYSIKGNTLGGLTAPLTFTKGEAKHKVPYCLFAAISNSDNSGWSTPTSKPICTSLRAPSDPNQ